MTLEEIIKKERKECDLIIFDAIRDNNGKGITLKKFIKLLGGCRQSQSKFF